MARLAVFAGLLALAACGNPDFRVANRLDETVSIDVHAPKLGIGPNCADSFETRFCDQEFEALGVVDFMPGEEQTIVVFEGSNDTDCADVLWLRVLSVGDLGPVNDRGTLLRVPADVEIELGAGRQHSVAFPGMTLRIDENGVDDLNQAGAPETCEALGRDPRG